MPFKKYISALFAVILLLILIVGGANWLINPYGIYNSPEITGINEIKPEVANHARMAKAYAIKKVKPQAICLGTSRAHLSINPDHAGWLYHPVYNLGLTGANIYEILRYFQHADETQPLKQVVLVLDFFSFSTDKENRTDFDESRLSVNYDGTPNTAININDIISSLFSLDALLSSLNTIRNQNSSLLVQFENGQMNYTNKEVQQQGGYRASFNSTIKSFYTDYYDPEGYNFNNINNEKSPFYHYRQILNKAYSETIDMRMAISACHAYQWEVLMEAGLWQKWEQWKETLVSINEEEAHRFGMIPYPLWDFSDYNEFTTETVPTSNDSQNQMKWYWDSSHFKVELGNLMLDRIFKCDNSSGYDLSNFGSLISSKNINEHIARLRAAQQQYHSSHPDDIMGIRKLLKDINSSTFTSGSNQE